jgi:guanylate kinase
MDGKLYVAVGFSGSGKSSVEKELHKHGFLPVVSCSSRNRREYEVDGKDYYFLTRKQFEEKIKNDEMIEFTEYNSWLYGIEKKEIDLSKGNYVLVTNPQGLKQLKKHFGDDKVVGIYLYLSDHWELLRRTLDREPHASIDKCKEICRRYLSDFETFSEAEKACILKINNIHLKDTVDIILRNIANGSI